MRKGALETGFAGEDWNGGRVAGGRLSLAELFPARDARSRHLEAFGGSDRRRLLSSGLLLGESGAE